MLTLEGTTTVIFFLIFFFIEVWLIYSVIQFKCTI